MGLHPVLDRVLPGQPGHPAGSLRVFPSPVFSSTRPGSSLGVAGSGVARQAGPGFKTVT